MYHWNIQTKEDIQNKKPTWRNLISFITKWNLSWHPLRKVAILFSQVSNEWYNEY
jgi:hypothetical protein